MFCEDTDLHRLTQIEFLDLAAFANVLDVIITAMKKTRNRAGDGGRSWPLIEQPLVKEAHHPFFVLFRPGGQATDVPGLRDDP
jgi:hypothetical protein